MFPFCAGGRLFSAMGGGVALWGRLKAVIGSEQPNYEKPTSLLKWPRGFSRTSDPRAKLQGGFGICLSESLYSQLMLLSSSNRAATTSMKIPMSSEPNTNPLF